MKMHTYRFLAKLDGMNTYVEVSAEDNYTAWIIAKRLYGDAYENTNQSGMSEGVVNSWKKID